MDKRFVGNYVLNGVDCIQLYSGPGADGGGGFSGAPGGAAGPAGPAAVPKQNEPDFKDMCPTGEWSNIFVNADQISYRGVSVDIERGDIWDRLGWFNFEVSGSIEATIQCTYCSGETAEISGTVGVENAPVQIPWCWLCAVISMPRTLRYVLATAMLAVVFISITPSAVVILMVLINGDISDQNYFGIKLLLKLALIFVTIYICHLIIFGVRGAGERRK